MTGEEDERNRLGDLPIELQRERGESGLLNDRERSLPGDMLNTQQARESAARAGIGGPVLDYTVRGVYDSRPVNGFDFNQVVELTLTDNSGNPFRYACLQVPQGRVVVLRAIQFYDLMDVDEFIQPDSGKAWDIMVQLTRNGGAIMPIDMDVKNYSPGGVTYMDQLPIKGGDTLECFSLFDEGEVIGINALLGGGVPTTSYMYVKFYGNILLKTGIPANFEVANKAAGKPTQVMASQSDLLSAQSPAMRSGAVPGGRTVTGERMGVPPRGRR